MGSTPCCGTNVTFSRKALLSVGGFTYGSITEDFLTSMTLHSHGCVRLGLLLGLVVVLVDSGWVGLRWDGSV